MSGGRRRHGPPVDMTSARGRAGLTARLQRQAKERKRLLLPLYRVPQVPDRRRDA